MSLQEVAILLAVLGLIVAGVATLGVANAIANLFKTRRRR